MANRRIVSVSAVLLLVVLSATDSRAAIYHVGPKGTDNAEGTGDAPWQTLAKAVYSAAPGDTILLATGSYAFKLPKKPFDKKMVTIRPAADAGDDKPFMEMWKAYFRKMQVEVKPPDPPTS